MSSCTLSPPPMKVKGSTVETPADRNANFTCLHLPPNSLMFLYDNYFFISFHKNCIALYHSVNMYDGISARMGRSMQAYIIICH